MQDTDQWQEHYANRVSNLESDVEILQDWRAKHMSECHPAILTWQGTMWGNWLKVTGIAAGVALVIGFILGQLWPLLEKWAGK